MHIEAKAPSLIEMQPLPTMASLPGSENLPPGLYHQGQAAGPSASSAASASTGTMAENEHIVMGWQAPCSFENTPVASSDSPSYS
eukprot:5752050-Prorocentrum_lima.AAC.1